jgi:ADP-heptose:LPS heptosyltransferase
MRVLFIRFGSLGDATLVTGVLRCFAEMTGNVHRLSVLTFKVYADVFNGLDFIDTVHTVHKGISLKEYIRFLKTLTEYDLTVDLHSNFRSRLAGFLLKGRVLRYDKQAIARRLFTKFRVCAGQLHTHTVERYAAVFFPFFGLPVPEKEFLRPYLALKPGNGDGSVKNIVIHPFASKPTKEWPYFPELTETLSSRGFNVQIVGRSADQPEIAVKTPAVRDLIEVIAQAELLITTDSGPMHIGVALNKKVIAIFGSTSKEFGFYPDFAGCSVIEEELSCRPCHIHGAEKCKRGDFACMRAISPERVLETVCQAFVYSL